MSVPTREEALLGLRRMRDFYDWRDDLGGDLDRAIAYLEELPERCLAAERKAFMRAACHPMGSDLRCDPPTEPEGCR